MFTIKQTDRETDSTKFNIRLDLIAAVLFAVPLFITMPEWYLSVEAVVGIAIIVFSAIGVASISAVLLSKNKANNGLKFFDWGRVTGLGFAALILTSMFIQEMDTLFVIYLIIQTAFQLVTYMWMRKPLDSSADF